MTARVSIASYAGLRTSVRLRDNTETFITNIRDDVRESQTDLLVEIMEGFLDEAVDALIIGACEAVQLRGVARKGVDLSVATIKASCHLLSRRVLRNMKNEDVRDLAEHMDDLRLVVTDDKGHKSAYTIVPLDAELHRDILQLFAMARDENPSRHIGMLSDVLFRLLDVVVEHLYVRTLATLRLGPIARRVVEMGYRTVISGAHTLLNRVLPNLSDEQIRAAAEFCRELILTADGRRLVPAAVNREMNASSNNR